MKVADLTVEEFRAIVREVVCEVLAEFEDEGELNPDFEAELLASLESDDCGTPLGVVAREHGVEL